MSHPALNRMYGLFGGILKALRWAIQAVWWFCGVSGRPFRLLGVVCGVLPGVQRQVPHYQEEMWRKRCAYCDLRQPISQKVMYCHLVSVTGYRLACDLDPGFENWTAQVNPRQVATLARIRVRWTNGLYQG